MASPGLNEIVSVNIVVQDAFPSAAGFGTPLIIDTNDYWGPDLVRSFSSTREMAAAGVPTFSALMKAATALFSQNPSPPLLKVARRPAGTHPDFSYDLKIVDIAVPDVLNEGDVYTVSFFGTAEASFSHTVTAAQSSSDVASALQVGLAGLVGPGLSVSVATNVLTFDGSTVGVTDFAHGVLFSVRDGNGLQKDPLLHFEVTDNTTDTGLAAAYDAIVEEDNDFYGVMMTTQSPAGQVSLVSKVEADACPRLAMLSSGNNAMRQGTQLLGSGSDELADSQRGVMMYHTQSFTYPEAAWAGRMLPVDPGAATWKFKTLSTISPYSISTTDRNTLSKRASPATRFGNIYQSTAGIDITCDGRTLEGRYIDIQRGIDWLTSRMQERLFAVLAQSQKIPYTDAGVAIIESEVRAQLLDGIAQGVLASVPEPVVTVPTVASIPAAVRATRTLPDIFFSAVLAGAVHRVEIQGVVTV